MANAKELSAFGVVLNHYMQLGGFKRIAALVRWCGRPGAPYLSRLRWGKQKNANWDLIFAMAVPLAQAIHNAKHHRELTVIELVGKIANELMGSLRDTSPSPSLENLAEGLLQQLKRRRRNLAARERRKQEQAEDRSLADKIDRQAEADGNLFRDAGLL